MLIMRDIFADKIVYDMSLFSERYGYTKPSEVIIREEITREIQNSICSCYDRLIEFLSIEYSWYSGVYVGLEKNLWVYFLNNREGDFSQGAGCRDVAISFLEDSSKPWYQKLDLIEYTIKYLVTTDKEFNDPRPISSFFIQQLNAEFERLNFAYRVVGEEITEITSQNEIGAIEEAMKNASHNIRMHLNRALELYSQRPNADYRNSIKESISAVEAFCREKTGESTLGKALNQLEKKGMVIPKSLKSAFDNLYTYTNQPDTGIRHALMDDEETYTPASEEALFMLVSCSAFLNYLYRKVK